MQQILPRSACGRSNNKWHVTNYTSQVTHRTSHVTAANVARYTLHIARYSCIASHVNLREAELGTAAANSGPVARRTATKFKTGSEYYLRGWREDLKPRMLKQRRSVSAHGKRKRGSHTKQKSGDDCNRNVHRTCVFPCPFQSTRSRSF